MIRVGRAPLSVATAYAELDDARAGGVVLFLGRVRPDVVHGRRVRALDYEAHQPVAEASLQKLAREAQRRFNALRIVLWHRIGPVPVGEPSVIVGVATEHRAPAFAAARFMIDRLKVTLPVWKSVSSPRPRRAVRRR
ncbi:MAG: molybdenum cofactor biosynthesis protein MoaE [Thermoplasmata archaeon]|nr:molybdenum cofactor biosynthesis protein MoaE [Thermoplasmata archaeon]